MRNIKFEKYKPRSIFYLLILVFLGFYVIQIPFWTSNSDVLVYACRALAETPIVDYAFLDERSLYLSGTESLPNYHLAHTIILWLIYRIVPNELAASIWPAGLVSAISGALAVGLTFLIWVRVGIKKTDAFFVAIVVGFIPSIWFQSVLGEVYALQLVFILLFLYYFLLKKVFISGVALLLANLVTPVSGLLFFYLFIVSRDKETLMRASIAGFFALVSYLLIYCFISSDIFKIFQLIPVGAADRSLIWVAYKVSLTLLVNLNFLLLYFWMGSRVVWREHRNVFYGLVFAAVPQMLVVFFMPNFFAELGCLQLPLFWILCLPIGLGISKGKILRLSNVFALLGLIVITQAVLTVPNKRTGRAVNEAGCRLQSMIPEEIKIVGHWKSSIGVVIGKYGWDFEKLSSNYIEKKDPTTADLLKTGEESLIIVKSKKDKLRARLIELGVTVFRRHTYDPITSIKMGTVQKIFENDAVTVYRWDKRL